MFALPPPRPDSQDALVQARIDTLLQHGYIGREHNKYFLTEKGWRTLSAAAETRIAPHRPTKLQLENELLESKLTSHHAETMLHRG